MLRGERLADRLVKLYEVGMKRLFTLTVNREEHEIALEPRDLLGDVLRNTIQLTGTKRGCETGTCGACTILLNGRSVKSCLMLGIQAKGADITTIEGLKIDGKLHPVQQAFIHHGAVQCGFCTPGMIMSTKALLDENPHPTDEEIGRGLKGNLCRCTGYTSILEAVKGAAQLLATAGAR
jgi:carbon-monoxide dehydrogenase small subunit